MLVGVNFIKPKNILLKGEKLNNWVYFVHSYYAVPDNYNVVAANVKYGNSRLTTIIENDNLLTCQFHLKIW